MEKETVTMFNLEAAFKALEEIEAPDMSGKSRFKANRPNLREHFTAKHAHEVLVEDYYDVNDTDDLTEAQAERDAEIAKAKLARIEKIVDLDAETEEDILPSYVGKVIMQCPQCMTLFYKNEEDIEKSEETPDVVNINEVCQHCGNTSGYTLVGKVGGINEDEAENFDLDEIEVDENELNLDFSEEGTEEAEAEDAGEAEEPVEEGEELDFDLDLAEEEAGEEELEDEETNESLHNSKLLKKIKADNDLKSNLDSEHLTLNEDLEDSEETNESLNNSELLKNIEKKNELKTEHGSENLTLNETLEDSLVEDAEDNLFNTLWSEKQPTEAETEANLATINNSSTENTSAEEAEKEFDEFDEAFDEHVTDYLKEVYSNIESYTSTNCMMRGKKLVVEGMIKFQSGKEKATRFTFDSSRRINNALVFRGMNEGLTSEKSAFRLACKTDHKKLVTESFSYNYSIDGATVAGKTKK